MACNKSFSSDYMILDTENVELFDLFHLLFSSDLDKRKFIDCPPGTEQSFSRRWLIFASVAVQKMLQGVSKPLSGFGSGIEYWLNLLTSNSSFGRLLLNVLQGKVIYPDKTSASFISFNGNLDTRLSLDPNIKHGDCRYHAALSVMAAKVSYENKAFIESAVRDHWKMDFLGYYDFWNDYQAKNTTQAFMFRDKTDIDSELIVVSFRGTEPFDSDAWSTDIDLSWYELPCVGKIHGGFMKSLGLQRNQGWPKEIDQTDDQKIVAYYGLTKMLRQLLEKNDKAKFIVTGHSLGGALAILFPAVIMIQEDAWLLERLQGIYTFGQPRVGDEKFGEYMKEQLVKYNIPYYRFVYGNDLVPRLPYDDASMMFKHFGTCVYYDSYYKGQIVDEEPNKNYFSLLYFIPKTTTAIYEFFRSFIIPYTKGYDYCEGGLLRFMRLVGLLLLAGAPAHCPQDYVNATRLGSPDVFLVTNNKASKDDDKKTS